MKYKISQYARLNNVTTRTVWNWIYRGELNYERTKTNRVLIITDDPTRKQPNVAVYSRVSSSENKSNLETQKNRLISFCNAKGYSVIKSVSEIGSGLNDKRPQLEKLLLDSSIDIIVVEHKDRLARFGVNYIEKLLSLQNRRLEIVNPQENDRDDLMQDFVSIITSFCARLYGQRRTKRNTEKIIKELEKDA
jgi:predicted site-specific integrase-resolvase